VSFERLRLQPIRDDSSPGINACPGKHEKGEQDADDLQQLLNQIKLQATSGKDAGD
jgi:hypothetical protein